jgi:riboflavin biosynthesis pyrimidine reductase
VYSTSLDDVATARTRLAASFDPAEIEALKATSVLDVSVGGPTLAAEAFRADLVDDVHLFLHPVLVGGGTRALPDDVHVALDLVSVDRVGDVVHLHHRVRH